MASTLCCLIPSLLVSWKPWKTRTGCKTVTQWPELNLISPTVQAGWKRLLKVDADKIQLSSPSFQISAWPLSVVPYHFYTLDWQSCFWCPQAHSRLSPESRGMCAPGTQDKPPNLWVLWFDPPNQLELHNCNFVVQAFVPFPWALKRNEDRRVLWCLYATVEGGRSVRGRNYISSFSILRVKGSLSVQRFESVINHNLWHMKQSSCNLLQAFYC